LRNMSHFPIDKTYIFLPVEIKVRELHGKLLFALIAAEAGFAVVLGGQKELRRKLHLYPPGIYVDKSVAVSKERWFARFRRLGHRIVAWDEEGLVIHEQQYLKSRISRNALSRVELFFAWGPAQRDILVREFPAEKNRFLLSGNPRFDMLRPELRAFYSKAANELTEKYGPIILINTNFGFYNHFKGLGEAKKIFIKSSSHGNEKFIDDWIEFQRQLFAYFVESIPWLSSRFSDHTIVVRPHPSENDSEWSRLTAELENVKVSQEGNVLEWIVASDAVIHSNCTTGIETYLLGVPSIAYRPALSKMYETLLPNSVSKSIYSFSELQEIMIDIVVQNNSDKYIYDGSAKAIASQYISNIEGVLSADYIVDKLKKIDVRKSANVSADSTLRNYQVCLEKIRITKESVQSIFPSYKKADIYDKQKFPGVSIEEIENLIERFKGVTKRFSQIRTLQVGESCFLIENHK